MPGKWRMLPWPRRSSAETIPPPSPPPSAPPAVPMAVPSPPPPPLARPTQTRHHWLSIIVARPGPSAPVPAPGAKVVVRPFPRGAPKPGEPVARATTGADGTVSLQLPTGRYAVSARHGDGARAATITLEHSGRAMLVLDSLTRRVKLTIEASTAEGGALVEATVDVRTAHSGAPVARAVTDERGIAAIPLPPGAYEVRLGDVSARTYLEADTLLRVTAQRAEPEPAPAPVTRYAQRARAATTHVADFDPQSVREELWN